MASATSPRTGATSDRRPGQNRSIVPRTALHQRLSEAAPDTVILLVAPAGSGKTVLLRSWVQAAGLAAQTAWVSVERGEVDAQHFWTSVVDALRRVSPGAAIAPWVPSPDFDAAVAVDRLLSDLRAIESMALLVVDDVHELQSHDALEQLDRLLSVRPANLRLALATRHDPPLALHRLRLAGSLLELRIADLRFEMEESRSLLEAAGVRLSDGSLERLQVRTEGWAAGLRLAALSLAQQRDPEKFVSEFSGSDRTIADYLLSEVLQRQPPDVRELLLKTSIVERVDGSLAEALTGNPGAERILLELERVSAFVSSTGSDRSWFEYHQLFADLLRLELRRQQPEVIPDLHRRAAEWFDDNGLWMPAIRHAQAAGEWARAIELLAHHASDVLLEGSIATTRAMLNAFPPRFRSNPELAWVVAGVELTEASPDEAAAHLAIAQRGAAQVPAERRHAFELGTAAVRLAIDARRGDFESVRAQVQGLVDAPPPQTEEERVLATGARATALMNLGIVEYWSYRLADAERHLGEALDLARRIPRPRLEIICLAHLALGQNTRSLSRQRELAAAAVAVAETNGWGSDPVAAMPLAALGAADILQGRFNDGRPWVMRAQAALRPNIEPATELLVRFLAAMLSVGQGRLAAAVEELSSTVELQRLLVTRHVVTVLAHQYMVHVQLRLGDEQGAAATLAALSDDERVEGETRVAEADLMLHRGDARAALQLLAPVLDDSVRVIAAYTVIQARIIEALAYDALGERGLATAALEQALDLTEPDALILPFLLTAPRDILERQPRHVTRHAALLTDILDILDGLPGKSRRASDSAIAELSESEIRVLRFLPSNLSAPEIAAQLFLSTSTVKTHMRHIYDKLDAHKRTEAVQRARDLGLLASPARRTR